MRSSFSEFCARECNLHGAVTEIREPRLRNIEERAERAGTLVVAGCVHCPGPVLTNRLGLQSTRCRARAELPLSTDENLNDEARAAWPEGRFATPPVNQALEPEPYGLLDWLLHRH